MSPCQLHQCYSSASCDLLQAPVLPSIQFIAVPNLKLFIISEYSLEYLRSSHYLAEQLRVCHLDMPFNHITKWKDCINHWLYLSLAYPTYYFFQTCPRSLRCPQQIDSFEEKISEVDCREVAGGRTRGYKYPACLQ